MLNQFSRTQLLLGQDGMERLYDARVAVFGIGGVGGYTVPPALPALRGGWNWGFRYSAAPFDKTRPAR